MIDRLEFWADNEHLLGVIDRPRHTATYDPPDRLMQPVLMPPLLFVPESTVVPRTQPHTAVWRLMQRVTLEGATRIRYRLENRPPPGWRWLVLPTPGVMPGAPALLRAERIPLAP